MEVGVEEVHHNNNTAATHCNHTLAPSASAHRNQHTIPPLKAALCTVLIVSPGDNNTQVTQIKNK